MSFSPLPEQKNITKPNSKEFLDNNIESQALLQPLTSSGIMGWVFDIPKAEEIRLKSKITDHYTESNSFLNDHIIREPIRISLNGEVGELIYNNAKTPFKNFSSIDNKLTDIPAYEGNYTPFLSQEIGKNFDNSKQKELDINEAVDLTKDIITPFEGQGLGIKQKTAYSILYSFWQANFPLAVTVPWSFFPQMIIEEITLSQGEDSNSYTDVSLTLKEIRFAKTKTTDFEDNPASNRQEMQNQDVQDTGNIKGENTSILFEGFIGT